MPLKLRNLLNNSRATGVEKLTFSSLFDATYIFNKLKKEAIKVILNNTL